MRGARPKERLALTEWWSASTRFSLWDSYRHGIGPDRFEFQMFYGVRPHYQVDLAKATHRVLIATPYGPYWCLYLMRRLAERSANLAWFASNLIKR